ncbi:hypothetical protein JEZ13_04795 [bacterium]|nr:hypothetical protein [bacterium]
MLRKQSYILLFLMLLGLGCSQTRTIQADIAEVNKVGNLTLDFIINDLAYDSNTRTLYIAEKFKDYIWIYEDFKFINKFGGKGNNNSSFQLLTDLEVSENGNLLALDNLQKRIAIFDKNGIYRNNISLISYPNPSKFTLGSDDLLYLHDSNKQEIIIINLLTFQEFMRFGQFELDLPQAIRFNSNHINITRPDLSTDFFNSLGGFNDNYPTLTVKDEYGNTISLQNKFIYINNQPTSPLIIENIPLGMFLKGNHLVIYTQNEVLIYNLTYHNFN